MPFIVAIEALLRLPLPSLDPLPHLACSVRVNVDDDVFIRMLRQFALDLAQNRVSGNIARGVRVTDIYLHTTLFCQRMQDVGVVIAGDWNRPFLEVIPSQYFSKE